METEKKFYDEKFYVEEATSSQNAARKILPLVIDIVTVGSVLDIGCGVGMFLKFFKDHGVADIQGLDGDYIPPQHKQIPPENFRAHDLKTPFHLNRHYDLVMTLEVAEHLPDSSADDFVASICEHGDVVLFSAALPEQGGSNHINEQWPDYWAAKFAARGYKSVDCLRPALWDDTSVDFWYRQNVLLFANSKGLEKNPKLAEIAAKTPRWKSLNIVHPEMYAAKLRVIQNSRGVIQVLQQFVDKLNPAQKAG